MPQGSPTIAASACSSPRSATQAEPLAAPSSSSAVKASSRSPRTSSRRIAAAACTIAATAPFMSAAPRPYRWPSTTAGSHGGRSHRSRSPGGFVSRWPLSSSVGPPPRPGTRARTLTRRSSGPTTRTSSMPRRRRCSTTTAAAARSSPGGLGVAAATSSAASSIGPGSVMERVEDPGLEGGVPQGRRGHEARVLDEPPQGSRVGVADHGRVVVRLAVDEGRCRCRLADPDRLGPDVGDARADRLEVARYAASPSGRSRTRLTSVTGSAPASSSKRRRACSVMSSPTRTSLRRLGKRFS